MTNEQFIYWLRGFIEYQQLQEQKNPAFNMIKTELEKLNNVKTGNAYTIPFGTGETYGVINTGTKLTNTPGTTSITYKTDSPITYTTN
jgi:hypothetical protein